MKLIYIPGSLHFLVENIHQSSYYTLKHGLNISNANLSKNKSRITISPTKL